jgi:DNA processing protein
MDTTHINLSDYGKHNLDPLLEIPQPPQELWSKGILPPSDITLLAVVGSRQYTTYGKQALNYLIDGLKDYPIGVVSGLALGIDALAHEAALRNNLYTLAIPGSGLEAVAPATNRGLAERILEQGGGLLSELSPETGAAKWTFPSRNRIIAGLCKGTLLVEAAEKSGTLITARMTVDYNRELLAIPGSIFSNNSYGTHQFLKLGATMVTEPSDILYALGIEPIKPVAQAAEITLTPDEKLVITILSEPRDKDTLLRQLPLPVSEANILLMNMEMQGYIAYDSPHYRALI